VGFTAFSIILIYIKHPPVINKEVPIISKIKSPKAEERKYIVTICRCAYSTTSFKVIANSEEGAKSLALELAYNYEWSTKGSDYTIEDISTY
jgi:hypothetical protein